MRLSKELSVLDGDNIHSMMASEEAVDNLMDLLTTSIAQVITKILLYSVFTKFRLTLKSLRAVC